MASKLLCEFCNSSFSTKSNLAAHQKRTKKCLKLQNKEILEDFVCTDCSKTFTSKQTLIEHIEKCAFVKKNIELQKKYSELEKKYLELEKNYKIMEKTTKSDIKHMEKQLEQKDKQISELQNKITKIAEIGAKKETTVNSIKVNNKNILNQLAPFDLTKEKIESIIDEKFNENYLYAKENGIAFFAINNLLKDENGKLKMLCTDTARKTFIYKNEQGEIYKDPDASNFTKMYIPPLEKKSHEIIANRDNLELYDSICLIGDMKNNPGILSNRLSKDLITKPE